MTALSENAAGGRRSWGYISQWQNTQQVQKMKIEQPMDLT